MQESLTLHEDAGFRNALAEQKAQVTGYRVGGFSDGKTVRIANFGAPVRGDWRIMQMDTDDPSADWTGHYESLEEALVALRQR